MTEAIGIALDVPGNRMFLTDLAGSVYSAKFDGSQERTFLYARGNLTGIAYAERKPGNRTLFTAVHFVRFWHKADIPVALSNVRFWG